MIKRDQPEIPFDARWQTVTELSFYGVSGCEYKAIEKVAEILASAHVPESILMEAKQAVACVIEKEISTFVSDQVQRSFTILVQAQLSEPLEYSIIEADGMKLNSGSRGIGFFLTEKRTLETESGNIVNHVFISVHLYREDHLV